MTNAVLGNGQGKVEVGEKEEKEKSHYDAQSDGIKEKYDYLLGMLLVF